MRQRSQVNANISMVALNDNCDNNQDTLTLETTEWVDSQPLTKMPYVTVPKTTSAYQDTSAPATGKLDHCPIFALWLSSAKTQVHKSVEIAMLTYLYYISKLKELAIDFWFHAGQKKRLLE